MRSYLVYQTLNIIFNVVYSLIKGSAPTSSHVNHQTCKNNKGVHIIITGTHLLKQYGGSYSHFVVDK